MLLQSGGLARMDSNLSIPLIDFHSFLHGSIDDRKQIASVIDEALSSVGFIYLSNHGIDQRKIDTCFRWVSRIFHCFNIEWQILADILSPYAEQAFLCPPRA